MSDRRAFLATALASLAIPPLATAQPPAGEVGTFWIEVGGGATLWCVVAFTADEPVELTIKAGKTTETLRGRFDGRRLAEFSWRNESAGIERVGLRATAMKGDRELPAMRVQFTSEHTALVGFGQRGTPADRERRNGGYPHHVMFMGLIVYGA